MKKKTCAKDTAIKPMVKKLKLPIKPKVKHSQSKRKPCTGNKSKASASNKGLPQQLPNAATNMTPPANISTTPVTATASNATNQVSSQVSDFAAALSRNQMLRMVKHQIWRAKLWHQLGHQQQQASSLLPPLPLLQEHCIQEATSAVQHRQRECIMTTEKVRSPPLSSITPNRLQLQETLRHQQDHDVSPSQSPNNRESAGASVSQVTPTSTTLAEASVLRHQQELWALVALEANAAAGSSLGATLAQSDLFRYNNDNNNNDNKNVEASAADDDAILDPVLLKVNYCQGDSETNMETSTGMTIGAASYQFIRTEVELQSLQQLSSELDEEDKEFIVSLRHLL